MIDNEVFKEYFEIQDLKTKQYISAIATIL